jgi:hypothetical protein
MGKGIKQIPENTPRGSTSDVVRSMLEPHRKLAITYVINGSNIPSPTPRDFNLLSRTSSPN